MPTKRQLEIQKKQELDKKYWDTLENIAILPPSKVVAFMQASGRDRQQIEQDLAFLNRK